jgi:hypothetical protein
MTADVTCCGVLWGPNMGRVLFGRLVRLALSSCASRNWHECEGNRRPTRGDAFRYSAASPRRSCTAVQRRDKPGEFRAPCSLSALPSYSDCLAVLAVTAVIRSICAKTAWSIRCKALREEVTEKAFSGCRLPSTLMPHSTWHEDSTSHIRSVVDRDDI